MSRKKKFLLAVVFITLFFGIIAYAEMKSGFLIVEYNVGGGTTAEHEMFTGAEVNTAYQDAIPVYRTEPGVEPVIGFGWVWCMDGDLYSRLFEFRFADRKVSTVSGKQYSEIPVEAIDVDPGGSTICRKTALFFIGLKKAPWCGDEDVFCMYLPTFEITPIGGEQPVKLAKGDNETLTINAALWQVIEPFSSGFGKDHFTLEQVARTVDFFGIEKDISKIKLSENPTAIEINLQCQQEDANEAHAFCKSRCPCDDLNQCTCDRRNKVCMVSDITECPDKYSCVSGEDCACISGCSCRCVDGECQAYDCEQELELLISETVDRIWGQCGIQFKLAEHWGRASVGSSKYQLTVEHALTFPAGIETQQTSTPFMKKAQQLNAFVSNSVNIYLFPNMLKADECPDGYGFPAIFGASYPRDLWDGGSGCSSGYYCRGGDVFINNDAGCTSKALWSGQAAYSRLSRTIAHEIGHILLQDAGHYQCSVTDDNNNLMAAQGENGCNETTAGMGHLLKSEQCAKARNTIAQLNWLLAD